MGIASEIGITPIFAAVDDALRVAYQIEAYESSPRTCVSIILDRMMTQHDIWRHKRGTKRVDFSGMDKEDIAAQCAMIRSAVKHLETPESRAIQAHYGVFDFSGKHPRFTKSRVVAVRYLAQYLQPQLPDMSLIETNAVIVKVLANNEATYRDMSDIYGGSAMKYQRAAKVAANRINALRLSGIDRLRERFESDGLIGAVA